MFCAAMDERHADLLGDVLRDKKVILSFFGNRYDCESHPQAAAMAAMAGCVVTDSQENTERIKKSVGDCLRKITDISPYDTRVDFGISQQLDVQKILVPVDGLEDDTFRALIGILGKYIEKNDYVRIHLFTREADYDKEARILEQVRLCLKSSGLSEKWGEIQSRGISENALDNMGDMEARFLVEQCVDELSVSKCMREQRILVDMRPVPALYLQILAISMGIPQIVCQKTQFINDGRNGLILRDIAQLEKALEYYLDGLSNWNDAMVYSFELSKKYASDGLISKWKEVIDFVG